MSLPTRDAQDLASKVSALPRIRVVAFAAATAGRSSVLFPPFRGPSPPMTLDDALTSIWQGLRAVDLDRPARVWQELESIPEADVEGDSLIREYYACWAVGAVRYVGLLATSDRLASDVLGCIYYELELADNLEAELGFEEGTQGPIVSSVADAQLACYEALAREPSDVLPVEDLLRLSVPTTTLYADAAPRVATARGWVLAT